MLINFSLRNFKSFRDEQSLSFVSSMGDEFPKHTIELENGLRVNKICSVIGGNGVGKTQLFDAVEKFSSGITYNTLHELHLPYIFSKENIAKPTSYEIIITDSENKNFLRYGVSVLNKMIVSEYLFSRPIKKGAKESCIFERLEGQLSFKKAEYKKHETLIKPVLKDSGAVVTFANSLEIPELNSIVEWGYSHIAYESEDPEREINFIEEQLHNKLISNENDNAEYVNSFLLMYNHYIKSFPLHINRVEFTPSSSDGHHRFIYVIDNLDEGVTTIPPGAREFFFSNGTLNILAFLSVFLWAKDVGFSIFVDEIDSSIHHSLANALVKMVIDYTCAENGDGSQFVFSTHNIALLDDCIRRDELNIIYKDSDMSSHIVNASSFSVRKDSKISAKYFRGEFGMLPAFLDKE